MREYNVLIQAGIVFVVAVAVLPQSWYFGLIAIAVMVVPMVIAYFANRGDRNP